MKTSTSKLKTLLLSAPTLLLLLQVGGLAREKATVPTADKPQESPALRQIEDSIAERENQLVATTPSKLALPVCIGGKTIRF